MKQENINSDRKENQLPEEEEVIEELVLLDHELTDNEHNIIVQSLKTFLNSALVPMTTKPTKFAIKALKKQKKLAQNLLDSMGVYSKEMAVSTEELSILRRALKKFSSLPKPLWQDIKSIRKMENDQTLAVALLDNLKIEEIREEE